MSATDLRQAFADFLDRLATGKATIEEWHAFAVAHYGDAVLEDVRRRCVRTTIAAAWGDWSAAARQDFRVLAAELRR